MSVKTLYSSKEIKAAIRYIFSNKEQRRIAITAFVGDEADAYLPSPKGMELYCWFKAGGTNPNAIRDLQTKGVNIYLSDSLHMKVYWSKEGAIITSANLSTNALGAGGLKEIGVLLSASSINIEKVISSLNARKVRESDIVALEKAHKKIHRTNPDLFVESESQYSFAQWYELSNHGAKWKFGLYYPASVRLSQKGAALLIKEHGDKSYMDIMEFDENPYKQDDWILCYEFDGRKPIGLKWMYAHHIVKASRKIGGKTKHYYQVIQVNKLNAYGEKPFEIDLRFRKAFKHAHSEYYKNDMEKMERTIPSKKLLKLMYEHMTKTQT